MINDYLRLKEVRKSLKLTLVDFGKKLGVRDSTISSIETGKNALTDQMIKAVCAIYNVNENWLRNGDGEMFVFNSNDILTKLQAEQDLDDMEINLIKSYCMLTKTEQAVFRKFLKNYVKEFEQKKASSSNSENSENDEAYSFSESSNSKLEISAEKIEHINIKHH